MFLEFFVDSSIEQNRRIRRIRQMIVTFNPINPINPINDRYYEEMSAKQKTAKPLSLLGLQRFLIPQIPQIPHLIVHYGGEQISQISQISQMIVRLISSKIPQFPQIPHLIVDYGEILKIVKSKTNVFCFHLFFIYG